MLSALLVAEQKKLKARYQVCVVNWAKSRLISYQGQHQRHCSLFEGDTQESREFLENIRRFNAAFAMSSFGSDIVRYGGWNPSFKIHGQVHHRIGPVYPSGNEKPVYLQVYFMGDLTEEAERHCEIVACKRRDIIEKILSVLREVNPYVRSFKAAQEMAPQNEDYKLVIEADQRGSSGIHRGRLRAPQVEEIAIVITGGELGNHRDIVLEPRGGGLKKNQ